MIVCKCTRIINQINIKKGTQRTRKKLLKKFAKHYPKSTPISTPKIPDSLTKNMINMLKFFTCNRSWKYYYRIFEYRFIEAYVIGW